MQYLDFENIFLSQQKTSKFHIRDSKSYIASGLIPTCGATSLALSRICRNWAMPAAVLSTQSPSSTATAEVLRRLQSTYPSRSHKHARLIMCSADDNLYVSALFQYPSCLSSAKPVLYGHSSLLHSSPPTNPSLHIRLLINLFCTKLPA